MPVLLLVPACSFGARFAASSDAPAAIDTRSIDAPLDAPGPTCMERWLTHTVRFNTPTALVELNTTDYERDPWLTEDEKTIYFSAIRPDSLPLGAQDIYVATRSSTADPFGPATKFAGASTTSGAEGKMSMTGDGLQLFVASDMTSGSKGSVDVWFAASTGTAFGPLGQTHMAMVNTSDGEYDPLITPDGTALYFAPSVDGAPQQIYVANRGNEAASFMAPAELTELADVGGTGTADPTVSPDQKVILFTSARTGTMGSSDIWYATRDDVSRPFSAPMPVPDINGVDVDGDAYLSQDGCRVYFDSTRNAPSAFDWDLFVAVQQ